MVPQRSHSTRLAGARDEGVAILQLLVVRGHAQSRMIQRLRPQDQEEQPAPPVLGRARIVEGKLAGEYHIEIVHEQGRLGVVVLGKARETNRRVFPACTGTRNRRDGERVDAADRLVQRELRLGILSAQGALLPPGSTLTLQRGHLANDGLELLRLGPLSLGAIGPGGLCVVAKAGNGGGGAGRAGRPRLVTFLATELATPASSSASRLFRHDRNALLPCYPATLLWLLRICAYGHFDGVDRSW